MSSQSRTHSERNTWIAGAGEAQKFLAVLSIPIWGLSKPTNYLRVFYLFVKLEF
jgi:hypothetical protein